MRTGAASAVSRASSTSRVSNVSIARVGPLGRALPVRGAAEGVDLSAHQLLGEGLHHVAEQVGVGLDDLLAKPGRTSMLVVATVVS
jgi:hypothetical protein